ncbi:MAG: hypothetical protein WBX01_11615 [Nitrososphaeraceae archaeon]|jgi:hypothetical protein
MSCIFNTNQECAVKRKAKAFSKALLDLDISYDKYVKKIGDFKKEIA